MQKLVFINGVGNEIDLTAGNFGIVNWAGLSNTSLNIQTQQVPFEDGGVFLDALMEQREIEVTIAIYDGNNLELRYQKKRELISALNPKLGEGTLIYTNDYLSKQIKAVPQIPLFENKNSNDAGTLKVSIAFSCCNPYWEDINDSVVLINSGETVNIENNGDVPCGMKIDLYTDDAENPKIINYKNEKEIEYSGVLQNDLFIDTNLGNKIVQDKTANYNNVAITTASMNNIRFLEEVGLFIAVGYGAIYKSIDGYKWTYNITGFTLFDICYCASRKLFVAVGSGGGVYTSTDSNTWIPQTSGVNTQINKIIYVKELSLFVAVGNSGTVITSEDGINWNVQTSGVNTSLNSVVYSAEKQLFVAVGETSTIITSSDGITWTTQTSSGSYNYDDVIYGGGRFVIVGRVILYSDDGITWNSATVVGTINEIRCIVYSARKMQFIAVDWQGTFFSSDGEDWIKTTESTTSAYKTGICYSEANNIFVITGYWGILAISTTATNWEFIIEPCPDYTFYGIAYSKKDGLYIAVGRDAYIYESPDGKNWNVQQQIDFEGGSRNLFDVIYVEELQMWVIVGNEQILTSVNGKDWIARYSSRYLSLSRITYSSEKHLFVAGGQQVALSNDGITWQEYSLESYGGYIIAVIYAEIFHKFYATFNDGVLRSSLDGIDWSTVEYQTAGSGEGELRYICCVPKLNMIVVTSTTTKFLTTKDGENWTPVDAGRICSGIIYSKTMEKFIAVRQYVVTSVNGYDWVTEQQLTKTLGGVFSTSENDLLLIYGSNFTILYSTYQLNNNRIDKLTPNSNMGLDLDIGNNQMQLLCDSGNIIARIKYRQKYIGV